MNQLAARFVAIHLALIAGGPLRPLALGDCACANEAEIPIELLPPTGPLSIGRTSFHWVDTSREQLAAEASAKCELMVHVWYPAKQHPADSTAAYIPGFSTIRKVVGEATLKAEVGTFYDALASVRTHVVADAELESGSNRYPIVLVTHGLRYNALGYSMLSEDLASHGYIVVGVDHPSTAFAVAFPDQRVTRFPESKWNERRSPQDKLAFESQFVNFCAEDLVFVLDQLQRLESGEIPSRFKGRLDLDRIGVFGHSFGGRVAARASQLDQRLKAAVVSDALGRAMTVDKSPDGSTLEQPVMVQYARRVPRAGIPRLLALLQTPGLDLEEDLRRVRKEFCESVKGPSYEVTLSTPGIVHESFSDMPWLESGQDEATRKVRQRAVELTRVYTRAFFDRHLRGVPTPLLDDVPDNPEEMELSRHTFRGQ